MARRTRSNNSTSFKQTQTVDIKVEEVPVSNTADTEVDIDLGTMDEVLNMSTTATNKKEEVVVKAEHSTPVAPVAEYEEDMIDYDDDELTPVDSGLGSDDTPIDIKGEDIKLENDNINKSPEAANNTTEEHVEIQAAERGTEEERFSQAKYVISLGPQTLLTQSDMANALQLKEIGDAVSVNILVTGVTYEITWKVASIDKSEPQDMSEQCAALAAIQPPTALTVDTIQRKASFSLRDAAPLSGATPSAPHFTTKCKFGKFCTKGATCPFVHTIKPKLCTWINTAQGCSKGFQCEFSHENEDTKCTRSPSRFTCVNGKGCAFKHDDDVRKIPAPKPKPIAPPAPVQQIKVVDSIPPANALEGSKASSPPPAHAPTDSKANPQLGKGAGQKRNRDDDQADGNAIQRPKINQNSESNGHRVVKQHRRRGRGNGRGRGRGRGGASVGVGEGELRIRGAAGSG